MRLRQTVAESAEGPDASLGSCVVSLLLISFARKHFKTKEEKRPIQEITPPTVTGFKEVKGRKG